MSGAVRRPGLAVAGAVGLLLALTGCSDSGGGSGSTDTGSPPAATSGGGGAATLTIKDFAFSPATLTVKPGTVVTVDNQDSTPHTATATGSKAFDTGTITPGKKATFTAPSKPGSYPYICTIHPFMKGTLTVS